MSTQDASTVPPARQWWTLAPFLVAVIAVALVLVQQRRAERMAAVQPEPVPVK